MIETDKITKKQALKIIKLYRKMVKFEIAARYCQVEPALYSKWYRKSQEAKEQLYELFFGSHNDIEVGIKLGLIGDPFTKKKAKYPKKKGTKKWK